MGRVRIELTKPTAPVLQTGVTLQLYRLPRNQSDPGGVRTHDHRIKSPVLYQLSYRVKNKNPLSRVELDLSLRESNPLHPVRCATLAQGDISILNGD